MIDIIAPASMLAKDKHYNTHGEWIRNTSAKMQASGDLEKAWNGTVKGEAVKACIANSSWVAYCPYCKSAEAVDPQEKIFFCFRCNMLENDYSALPVDFPEPAMMAEIIAVLMERPMLQGHGPTRYERIIRMRPAIAIQIDGKRFGLGRAWHWEETIDDLRNQQNVPIAEYLKKKGES
jgi:hypothetical protein